MYGKIFYKILHAFFRLSQETTTLYAACNPLTDKKENLIFLIFKEIQKGSVAKSYMSKENLIFLIFKEIQKGSVAKSYMSNVRLVYG